MSGLLRRILIADDHAAIRRGVRGILEDHADLRVVAEAADGHSALVAARATHPHVAILDYVMPVMNGLALTAALKRQQPGIEIVILTYREDEQLLFDLLRAGARAIVNKSEAPEQLVRAVRQVALHRPFVDGVAGSLVDRIARHPQCASGSLSLREREVVHLITEGQSNREIADQLGISVKTVETHRGAAMKRLRLHSTAALVRYAIRNGIAAA